MYVAFVYLFISFDRTECARSSRFLQASLLRLLMNRRLVSSLFFAGLTLTYIGGNAIAEGLTRDDRPIRIAGTEIKDVFFRDRRSVYYQDYLQLMADYERSPQLTFLPVRRAEMMFLRKRFDCLFIANNSPEYLQSKGVDATNVIFSDPIRSLALHAYFKPGTSKVSVEDLASGLVTAGETATVDTIEYASDLKVAFKPLGTASLQAAIDLLEVGRVQAVLAFSYDIAKFRLENPNVALHGGEQTPIAVIQEVVSCWKNKKTVPLIEHVNRQIKGLKLID